ncbi:hypothetical protein WA556_004472 [Blastocystis sp. ATCC 50177/Nand II]
MHISTKRLGERDASPQLKRARAQPFSDANVLASPSIEPRSKDSSSDTPATPRYIHIQYLQCFNLAFERVCKYNIFQVLDRGVYPQDWTSYRMRWQTLYFEDESDRYELKRYAPSDEHYIPHLNYCLSIPFDSSRTVVLEENVDWKDIIWGLERVRINKRLIHLRYLVFYPNS